MFGNLFAALLGSQLIKAATWLADQSIGTKSGTEAVAHFAPLLSVVAQAGGSAAGVAIDKAAATGGNLSAVASLVDSMNNGG